MSASSISSLIPNIPTQQTQTPAAQKLITQAPAQPVATDGDSPASSATITPPVNIKA